MLRRMLVPVVGLVGIVACCSLGLIFWDGYYLPQKPCRPIAYPDEKHLGADASAITSDSIQTVQDFYDQHLDPKPMGIADIGDWRKEALDETGQLYWCYGNDINGLTTETGCIYINPAEAGTRIEYRLRRSEGGYAPCPNL